MNMRRSLRDDNSESVVKTSLLVFCSCLVVLTVLAWGIAFVNREFFHRGFPFSTPLFDPAVRFTDLTDMYARIRNLRVGGGVLSDPKVPFNYPAPALYVQAFFILLFSHPVIALTSFVVVSAATALVILRASLSRCAVSARWIDATLLITALCSYPFLFSIDRGNLQAVIWVFSFLGLLFFCRKRYLTSALFFALAVCIKPFPVFYFFLFLRKGLYKEIAAAVVTACVVNIIALKALGPTIALAYAGVQEGVRVYLRDYVGSYRNAEMGFDHSFFTGVKQLVRLSLGWPHSDSLHGALMTAYKIWTPVSGLIVLFCGFWFWRKPILNQLFAVVSLMLLVPPGSADYTLVDLYLPWGVFMIFLTGDAGCGRVRFPLRQCLWVLIPCAVLMTPQSYLTLAGGGFAGQVKALVLILLLFVAARIDMPCTLFEELPAKGATRFDELPAGGAAPARGRSPRILR
jgi:hypothetical protein